MKLGRILLVAALALRCGGAVTDPALEGFDHDPRPIAGRWVTVINDASAQPHVYEAELLPAGGTFLGTFEFIWIGRHWRVQFTDGEWDGVRLRFTTHEVLDGETWVVDWTATYFPPGHVSPGSEAALLLASTIIVVPFEYNRP